eukprot:6191698-Pleurochrysis_carterae.AAC.2
MAASSQFLLSHSRRLSAPRPAGTRSAGEVLRRQLAQDARRQLLRQSGERRLAMSSLQRALVIKRTLRSLVLQAPRCLCSKRAPSAPRRVDVFCCAHVSDCARWRAETRPSADPVDSDPCRSCSAAAVYSVARCVALHPPCSPPHSTAFEGMKFAHSHDDEVLGSGGGSVDAVIKYGVVKALVPSSTTRAVR